MFFLPKSPQFFTMLNQLAAYGQQAVQLLEQRIQHTVPQTRIAEVKQQGRHTVEQITDAVCRTFITPFDREDIQAFAFYLYRILKVVNKVNQQLEYRPIDWAPFIPLMGLLREQAELMVNLVQQMEKHLSAKGISTMVQRISDLEHGADRLVQETLAQLYKTEGDTAYVVTFILQKDLLQSLDKVADIYRDTANLAIQIVLKHS